MLAPDRADERPALERAAGAVLAALFRVVVGARGVRVMERFGDALLGEAGRYRELLLVRGV